MNFYEYGIKQVESLIPYARNSRTHSDEQVSQIAASIKEFGFTNPVLVNVHGADNRLETISRAVSGEFGV